ncbi:MAG: hypothetical protein R3C05_01600 [Pirellulaceae bacterium]
MNQWIGQEVSSSGQPTQRQTFVYDGGQITMRFENGQLSDRYLWADGVDQLLAPESGGQVYWTLTDRRRLIATA